MKAFPESWTQIGAHSPYFEDMPGPQYRKKHAAYLDSLPEGCEGSGDCNCTTCVERWWIRQRCSLKKCAA